MIKHFFAHSYYFNTADTVRVSQRTGRWCTAGTERVSLLTWRGGGIASKERGIAALFGCNVYLRERVIGVFSCLFVW